MRSTFASLETSKRGMVTHQLALSTTGHNVANASTPGYTRQRINFQTTIPWPAIGTNRPQIPGQLGSGVKAGSIDRIRDFYLDQQYRDKAPDYGYWSNRATALSRVEDIVKEPSNSGLNKVLDSFWESIEDVQTRPDDTSARKVMIERAKALKETFNFMAKQTETAREETKLEANTYIADVNTILDNINELNKQIMRLEVNGYKPNDLYDQRDSFVDQISEIMSIEVTRNKAPKHNPSAEGTYTIHFVAADGTKAELLNGETFKAATLDLKMGGQPAAGPPAQPATEYDYFSQLKITLDGKDTDLDLEKLNKKGLLFGAVESYGYVAQAADANANPPKSTGIYLDHLNRLDKMAFNFSKEFNAIHKEGFDLNKAKGQDFFGDLNDKFGAASKLEVKITNPNEIAAASKDSTGNNEIAKKLSDFILKGNIGKSTLGNTANAGDPPNGPGYNLKAEIEDLVSELGVQAEEANRMEENTKVLTMTADNNRLSVAGVSLDEEMVDLVRFQHAYNGSARMITVIDEMLDKIINGMGVVGR